MDKLSNGQIERRGNRRITELINNNFCESIQVEALFICVLQKLSKRTSVKL